MKSQNNTNSDNKHPSDPQNDGNKTIPQLQKIENGSRICSDYFSFIPNLFGNLGFGSNSEEIKDDDIDEGISKKASVKKGDLTKRSSIIGESTESMKNFIPKIEPKPEDETKSIMKAIRSSMFFSHLEDVDLQAIAFSMKIFHPKKDEVVIAKGQEGDFMYLVKEGEFLAFRKHSYLPLINETLRVYRPGEVFGELALLYSSPRSANVKAITDGMLYGLDRDNFNKIVKASAIKRREKYLAFLKKIPLLNTFNEYELHVISDALKVSEFKRGTLIVSEGEKGEDFFMMLEGNARILRKIKGSHEEVHIKDITEGDYFGEMALINDKPRLASILTLSVVKVASLDRESFERLLGPLKERLANNVVKYEKEYEKALKKQT